MSARDDGHRIFQIGVAPRRIDIITGDTGLDFAEAYERSMRIEVDGIAAQVLCVMKTGNRGLTTGDRKLTTGYWLRKIAVACLARMAHPAQPAYVSHTGSAAVQITGPKRVFAQFPCGQRRITQKR